jgi:hypothetical protein
MLDVDPLGLLELLEVELLLLAQLGNQVVDVSRIPGMKLFELLVEYSELVCLLKWSI